MPYDPKVIEPKWQAYWEDNETFRVQLDKSKPKYYVLDMFPYPSGEGLHVGHPEGYTATDIVARFKRMKGFNVLHPMGWDAFGLPAEQYAVQTGTHPRITIERNVDTFKRQLKSLGFSFDWSRELNTTDPGYFRWTQWIFEKLYEQGLAYEAEVPVNWCPELGTVLANEEVIDGKSERGGFPVVRLPLKQWMLRITAYADRLLDDLEGLDWPESIKKLQRDWIGRSEGANIRFPVIDHPDKTIEVFTTRHDTLFGATYMVLAPEHPFVRELTTPEQADDMAAYVEAAARKSERIRIAEVDDKTGVFTGAYAEHPATGARLPIWIGDYVLAGYGSGAVMGVPGHDQRDYDFARKFGFEIVEVVSGGDISEFAYEGDGVGVNSGFLDGLPTPEAKERMVQWLEEHDKGERAVTYKLRDWLFSRQRYWGEPFPVLHLEDGTTKLVPEDQLPVLLPELENFQPTGTFDTPLERVPEWINTTDPDTGEPATRDPNTMPQWAGSCWYYLRFCDPHNDDEIFDREAERYWMPVDLYIGGAEHAVLHLMYARFWHKVLFDLGVVSTDEPFEKLVNQGMVLGQSYRYYDDNISDDPGAEAAVFPSTEVRYDGERALAGDREVKARWVPIQAVRRREDGTPIHPEIEGLELEEVVERMSKSRGNVINPDEVVEELGADAMRLYEMFMGPLEKEAPWSTEGIYGVYRFLQRTYRLFVDEESPGEPAIKLVDGPGTEPQARLTAITADGVTRDIEGLRFNTAISKLMVWVRDIAKDAPLSREAAEAFLLLLAPFAPHLAEELWERIGHANTLAYEPWPEWDPALVESETVTLVIQVNGKVRDRIEVPADTGEEEAVRLALASERVQSYLNGGEPKKVIARPPRLVNVVV